MMERLRISDEDDDASVAAGAVFCRDELVCEILSRLPLKSLMVCKSVCKQWQSLINERRDWGLIPSLVITCNKPLSNVTNFFIMEDLFQGREAVHWFTTPWTDGMISYSVNGLFCIVEFGKGIRIFNPSTQQVTPCIETILNIKAGVENCICWNSRYGFGCDLYAKEHKAVCVWEIQRTTKASDYQHIGLERICDVMTVGDNKWRRIDAIPPPYNILGNPANVNGSIFWMNTGPNSWEAPDCNAIVAFDVESEKFSLIKIPNHVLGEPKSSLWSVDLLQVDGCLAMMHRRTSDGKVTLWILDGVKEVIVNETGGVATSSASSWNGTVYTSKWIEETISMPFDDWNGIQDLEFQSIAGTDMIIMRSTQEPNQPRNSAILYYYDRKKKTSRKVEIAGIHSLMHYPWDYSITTITKSLLPVQKQQQQQQLTRSHWRTVMCFSTLNK